MHDEIAVVEQGPPAFPDPFQPQRPHAFLLERLLDVMGDGGDLPVGRSRAKEEVVGEGGRFPDIQRANIGGLLFQREPRAPEQRFLGPCRYDRLPSFGSR